MPASRSTPRRGRSSSVVSNTSATSTRSRSRAKAPNSAASNASVASEATLEAQSDRPPLPKRTNSLLPDQDLPVKVQVINRDGKNIIIGRVKLPTQNGTDHAFLLKRFDTNAVVASSMFRIAFPWADKEEEDREMNYLASKFDTSAANGGLRRLPSIETPQKRGRGRPKKFSEEEKAAMAAELVGTLPEGSTGVRLQGTWIPCADAIGLAREYGLLRWAKPLIESQAEHTEHGPLLTPSKDDKVSVATPKSSKRARKLAETDSNAGGSPSVTRTRTTKKVHTDGTEETTTESTSTTVDGGAALTQAQIQEQIQKARELAAQIKANAGSSSEGERGSKRKAVKQKASADIDPLSDDEEDEDVSGNAVTRSLRKTARVARRRPIITTAGTIGAAGAIGAGALAWLSGGNIDVAQQLLQQGLANLGSLNLGGFASSWF